MKIIAFTFLMLLIPLALLAQQATIPALAIISSPGFFTALIAGIILAFGFQLILMNLSAAAGLSALHIGAEKMEKSVRSGQSHHQEGSSSLEKSARKVNAAFGVWAIITASISLFFAAWLAAKISTALTIFTGITLGLAIWGLFYIATMLLEMAAASSMVGSLMSLMRTGYQSFLDSAAGLIRKSPEQRAADTAREIADAVRNEIFGDINVRRTIQNYIDSLKPDYDQMRREITAVLNDAEIDFRTQPQGAATARIHTGTSAPSPSEIKGTVQAAASTAASEMQKVSREARSDKSPAEKIADTAMELAGMSPQEAEDYRRKVEKYLADTGKPELNPEGIKRDIDKLVSENPKAGIQGILSRLSNMDRSTITAILTQRKDMNKDEVRRIVDMMSDVVDSLRSRYEQSKETTVSAAESAGSAVQQKQGTIEARVQRYFNSLDNPELHYSSLKADFEEMLKNPKAGTESFISRLQSIHRHDIEQMVTHSGLNVSKNEVDQIIDRIEQVRDSVIEQAEQMREEASRRIRQAEKEAIHIADETRKVAASAAWWVFGAALISGVAAAAGGLIGIMR